MKIGDEVRGTGLAEVISVSEWGDRVTVRITEHPDRSVVGREYSAPKSHFEVVELETDDMFAQPENRITHDDRPHFVIPSTMEQKEAVATESSIVMNKDGVFIKGAKVVEPGDGGGYVISGKLPEPKKPFWKKLFGGK